VLLGTIIARGISRPVSRMASTIRAAAESNDLTTRLDIRRRDEIGQLAGSTNTLLDRMQQLVGDVAKVAHDVAGAASQIAASAEEMSASVSEVARQAASATDAAAESGKVAQAGGQAVEQTIHGMQRIHEAVECGNRNVTDLGSKAEQIGKVIAVINDVAEQTNLLALNAAIEAARAGEHGRGFAVVADEVRKLAERTTRATEEVASSIQAIQSQTRTACDSMSAGTGQVREGVELAEKAGNNLREIVTRATSVAGMISSISAASQQAGAGATESATAATHLAAKANDLLGLVNFKLK
jgi:methyl-accepting chemotaxis protein